MQHQHVPGIVITGIINEFISSDRVGIARLRAAHPGGKCMGREGSHKLMETTDCLDQSRNYRVEYQERDQSILIDRVKDVAEHFTALDPYISRLQDMGSHGALVLIHDETGNVVARRHLVHPPNGRQTISQPARTPAGRARLDARLRANRVMD
jgi:hypothetical protein